MIWLKMKIIKWHWKEKEFHHTWQPYDKPYANHDVNKTTIDVFNIFVISNITTLFLPLEISFIWLKLQIKGYFENEIQMQPCSLDIGAIWLFSYNVMFKNIFQWMYYKPSLRWVGWSNSQKLLEGIKCTPSRINWYMIVFSQFWH